MSELGINPKDLVGITKLRLDLIPSAAERPEAAVMALGACKYGEWNWRQNKVLASIYVAAARRHLMDWFDGIDDDPESGVSHLGHVRACMGILLDAQASGNLMDDRRRLEKVGTNRQPPTLTPQDQCPACGSQIVGAVCECQKLQRETSGYNVVAPSVATPGWLDKCAEALDETADEFYSWGGAKWRVRRGAVFAWNGLIDEWQESTLLPHQIRQDGKRIES